MFSEFMTIKQRKSEKTDGMKQITDVTKQNKRRKVIFFAVKLYFLYIMLRLDMPRRVLTN
ncbi:hypothetical protein T10_4288 [Trichinella papuae]|uniref:Uncharacterized protein n=1 Tax=Trichinella papuae TaxID=268474 RepID=A0A0V1LZU1_9BILA|nr:hypothetical protein T10_4288 [Trichinella papuae]